MKKILFTLAAFTFTTFAMAQTKVEDVAKFKSETIDLGKIKVGHPATATFKITNIGKAPLIIETADPTCGCTIGDYTKAPIAPGKEGVVTATYNAAGVGPFTKTMFVKFAGVDEKKSITITGEVLSEEDFSKLAPATPVKPAKTSAKASTGHDRLKSKAATVSKSN